MPSSSFWPSAMGSSSSVVSRTAGVVDSSASGAGAALVVRRVRFGFSAGASSAATSADGAVCVASTAGLLICTVCVRSTSPARARITAASCAVYVAFSSRLIAMVMDIAMVLVPFCTWCK